MAARVGGREQRIKTARAGMVVWEVAGERVRHAHPGCDRESIRWRNGATAYKGNKEPQRRGIFICPSTHSEGRRFIMDRCGIAFFFLAPQWSSLCWCGGEVGSVVLWRQQPHTTFPQRQENKMEDILCQARKLCCDSLVTSHGKGGTAKITLLPGPN